MRKLLLMILVSFCAISCGKQSNPVPYVSFNFQDDINPKYSALNVVGGYAYVPGYGVAGLILYHSKNGIVAYDRCSSFMPEKKCAVTIDDTGFQVVDPCSGSKFSLEDGSPVKAPASKALRSYTVVTTPFTIRVTN
ncbi:nitrite reductase/ring-hydroxylating ferredoxin subunit [Mucilaginibacter rubeus]|uniref:hypothetical protein n=1 Tax=Mucilaginibacter rubeus TaxID=2027860 RepID=UPI003392CD30